MDNDGNLEIDDKYLFLWTCLQNSSPVNMHAVATQQNITFEEALSRYRRIAQEFGTASSSSASGDSDERTASSSKASSDSDEGFHRQALVGMKEVQQLEEPWHLAATAVGRARAAVDIAVDAVNTTADSADAADTINTAATIDAAAATLNVAIDAANAASNALYDLMKGQIKYHTVNKSSKSSSKRNSEGTSESEVSGDMMEGDCNGNEKGKGLAKKRKVGEIVVDGPSATEVGEEDEDEDKEKEKSKGKRVKIKH